MTTSASGQTASARYPQVGSFLHTILVVAVIGGWAFLQKVLMDRTGAHPNRVRGYLIGLCFEWALFAVVLVGVGRYGGSISIVVGERWRFARQVWRDIGIALGFWVVALVLLWLFGLLLRINGNNPIITGMMPHGVLEATLWVALSVSAGICEEAIFRGYLQAQFMSATKSAWVGIVLSAAVFGGAHAYQGWRMTILIALYGLMFGSLAWWRGSVRPGMIAHAWQDSLSGVLAAVMRR